MSTTTTTHTTSAIEAHAGSHGRPKAGRRIGRLIAGVALAALAFGAVSGVQATPASAASTVNVGGYATCAWFGGRTLAASNVTIRLDSGGSSTVGTSSMPWSSGLYRMTFSKMPKGGTGAWMTVRCPAGSAHPGYHSKRVWLKPDWRNTTGQTDYRNA